MALQQVTPGNYLRSPVNKKAMSHAISSPTHGLLYTLWRLWHRTSCYVLTPTGERRARPIQIAAVSTSACI